MDLHPITESVIIPCGFQESNCGYCKSKGTSSSFGMLAKTLTCEIYQQLIDRGWRRSGTYLYKPNLKKSCCPAYTIRLDSPAFVPNKTQRKVLYKLYKFLTGKESDKKGPQVSYTELLEAIETHPDFEVKLERSEFSEEVFELFRKYQTEVHHENDSEISEKSFRRFLVDSPIQYQTFSNSGGDQELGSFHQKYYYKGKLIAVGVLDLLPQCVSSVYFMYDPTFGHLSLGKYSAMVEARLSLQLSRVVPSIKYYYLGFYIHSCAKMKYKASYQPSFLVDPISLAWVPFSECEKLLDSAKEKTHNGYSTFRTPTSENSQILHPDFPGSLDWTRLTSTTLDVMRATLHDDIYPLGVLCRALQPSYPEIVEVLKQCFAALGSQISAKMIMEVQ